MSEDNTPTIEVVNEPRKISIEDKVKIDEAQAQAREALLVAEKAELNFRNVVLNVYVKYGLTANHNIQKDGTITNKENS